MSRMEATFFVRERQALFWTMFLPAFMLTFFGKVFGGPGYIDFLVAGLVGMNLMSMSLFSLGAVLVGYRERGILRRLRVTPLTAATFVAAHVLNRYALGVVQAVFLLLLGYLLFGVTPRGSITAIFVVVTLGLFCFLAMGLTLASTVRHLATANGIANLVFLPSLFLGGAYFPTDAFPPLLRTIGSALPLAPFLAAFRDVYGGGHSLADVVTPLVTIAVWGGVGAAVSVRFFKWE
jgi:ABC-type multidrug transport system permease subunit